MTQQKQSRAAFGSDVVVDMLQALDIDYVALNPGASYRGLHDSLVNYSGGDPEIILCQHEEIAVAIAHGYGRAAGKPMAAALHNIVGLLHAATAIYNAWLDQAGMLLLGGTGPVAAELRRPYIDWVHTALVQGNAIRDYVKWDDQPASPESVIDSMLRAQQIITTEPYGPAYLCFDAGMQEASLDAPPAIPDPSRFESPAAPQAEPAALERAASLLSSAKSPVAVVDYLGVQATVDALVSLAEKLGMPVVDGADLYNFPSDHPLNLTHASTEVLKQADVVLSVNAFDLEQALTETDRTTRLPTSIIPAGAQVIDVSLRQYGVRSWGQTYGKMHPVDVPILASPHTALPALESRVSAHAAVGERTAGWSARHAELRARFREQAERSADGGHITRPWLALQTWEAVKDRDWVLSDRDLRGSWASRLWSIDAAHRYHGTTRGGLGNGLGRALGVVLANRGTSKFHVHFQPDGDLLFTPQALWTAAHHRLPLLMVMHNNRAYNNDLAHQEEVAHHRDRPPENAVVGIEINDPDVDFASIARGFGVHAEGPIERPEDLLPAIQRAAEVVASGRPALVDVVTVDSGPAGR